MTLLMSEYKNEEFKMNDYIVMFLDKYKRKSMDTMTTYKNALEMMSIKVFGMELYRLEKSHIEQLTHSVLDRYRTTLLDVNANTTVNNRISAIKSFLYFLTSHNAIDYDISKLDLIETLNDDSEITEMIPEQTAYEYAEYFENVESRAGLEKKWATLLLLETGNRAEEILKLKKNQFIRDGDSYILKSKGANKGKGNKEYIERIGVDIYNAIMSLNPDSEKVFSISYKALNNAFHRANEHFSNTIVKYTPHSLKHLAVTLEYRYTNDILAAQRKGKHASIETTRRYLKMEEVVHVGAYSRKLCTNTDAYKEVELDSLVNIIDGLPSDMKQLINERLEMMSKIK